MESGTPAVDDANVWGLISLKKGDSRKQRKVLNDFHKKIEVIKTANELEDSKKSRRVAFRGVKRQLNLWKGPVHKNRLADQLIFPLNDKAITITSSENSQNVKTVLHKELLKDDNESIPGLLYNALYKNDSQKLPNVNPHDKVSREVSKRLLEKIAERERERFLLARAAARNKRQNKIKSKRFHRHLKSRTLKEYEKESELLRKTNPKAFAERLVQAELARVKERASLRHRGGSKFAKSQKLRAKYDKEARDAVAEMHELGREVSKIRDLDGLSDTDQSDVDVSSESEPDSEETAFDTADSDDDNQQEPSGLMWWHKKTDSDKTEISSKPASSVILSSLPAENVLDQADVEMSNQAKISNPLNANPQVVQEPESDLIDSNDNGFFRELHESLATDSALQKQFEEEKMQLAEQEQPQDVDTFLPGWNSWTGPGTEALDEERRKMHLISAPKIKRKDSKKAHVIIKQRLNQEFKQHLVKSIPFPYNTPEQFEAHIAQPISREWTTESTHHELTRPKVTVQSGRIIRPISKSMALLRDKDLERFAKQTVDN